MARVVVVGGGFGGLASAARLARLGHEVTLLERAATLGGALSSVSADGFRWDAGPTSTLLPAVIRDLFRKSGRPVEKELELVPLEHLREHRFEDGSHVALPGGSRSAQLAAVESLGSGLGRQWVRYVDSYAAQWGLLRREYLERPWHPDLGNRDLARLLAARTMLGRRLRSEFEDERLRLLASHPFAAVDTDAGTVEADTVVCAVDPRRLPVLAGHVRRTKPAMPPVVSYLGLDGEVPRLPPEVVLHGDPMLVVRTGGQAPEGQHAWTVHGRGRRAEDVVVALARHHIDVRPHLVTRLDRSPQALVDEWGGSPLGVLWRGRSTVRQRLGPTTPVPGVYAASAALVAQAIGPA